jgi:hypothetical protein
MKTPVKRFFQLALLAITSTHASAQGYLAFNNISPDLAPVMISSLDGTFNPLDGPAGAYVGSNYTASLYFVTGTVTDPIEFDARMPILLSGADTRFLGTTGIGPAHGPYGDGSGFFNGRAVIVPASQWEVTVQVRAWYNGNGVYSSYTEALAAGHNVGKSNPVLVLLGLPPGPIPELTGLQPFTVGIPEPSTFVLAALGGALLLLFRRRR